MKILKITANQGYTVAGVRIYHQFSDTQHGFSHRLVANGITADWGSYHSIATFQLGKRSFAATTEYYDALPRVFEIIKGVADVQDHGLGVVGLVEQPAT